MEFFVYFCIPCCINVVFVPKKTLGESSCCLIEEDQLTFCYAFSAGSEFILLAFFKKKTFFSNLGSLLVAQPTILHSNLTQSLEQLFSYRSLPFICIPGSPLSDLGVATKLSWSF